MLNGIVLPHIPVSPSKGANGGEVALETRQVHSVNRHRGIHQYGELFFQVGIGGIFFDLILHLLDPPRPFPGGERLISRDLKIIVQIGDAEEDQEEDRRGKDIHPDRVEIPGPPAPHVFRREETGTKQQILERGEELAIEMRDIGEEMHEHAPESFLRLKILLATYLAEPALHDGTTIETILLLPLGTMGHVKFSLK